METGNRAALRLDAFGLFIAGFNNTILALLVALFIHGPGTTSSQPDLLLRASWISENVGMWKAGWFFWFVPTLSFSWSYFALGRNLPNKMQWRDLAIGLAIMAAAVDVIGMLINAIVLPDLATQLMAAPNPDATLQLMFQSFEKLANNITNVGGFGLYSVAGLLLLPAAFVVPSFPVWLKWIGVIEWGVSIIATILVVVAPALAAIPLVIAFMFYGPWVWGCAWWLLKIRPASETI